jgi:phenylacetate-CoA ligase
MGIKPRILYAYVHMLSEIAHRTDAYRCLPIALACDKLGAKKLEDLQVQKLRRLLTVAWESSAFYHERMRRAHFRPEDVHSISDLKRLEPTRKAEIREAMARGRILTQPTQWLLRGRTSGSIGRPLISYHSRSPSYGAACLLRAYTWYGWRPGDTIVTLAYERGTPGIMRTVRRVENRLKGTITLHRDPFNDDTILRYLRLIDRVRPTIFASGPSVLCEFARVGHSRKLPIHGPKAIVTTAEMLLPHQRREISSYFGTEVFDQYGSSEVNSIAFECPTHKGLHVAADHVILETDLDGGVLVTDLDNSAMPFIRYEIGDAAVWRSETCRCGRASPLLSRIIGRRGEVLWGPNGNRIFSEFLSDNLIQQNWIEHFGMSEFQVVQERLNFIRVRTIVSKKPVPRDEALFTRLVRNHLGDVEVSYEYVDKIPLSPGGKRQHIVSKLAN